MDLPRYGDLFRIGGNKVLSLNGNITIDAVNRPGTDLNIDIAASAAIGDECMGQLTTAEAGTFIDSCSSSQLDKLLFDRYSLLRNTASPAVGSVNFQVVNASNASVSNPTAFAIPVNTVLQTTGGQQFITTVSSVYPQSSAGPITISVQSVLAGSNQQAANNTISAIVSTIPGGPSSPNKLIVINPLATAGASDDETTDEFRARGRSFFATARRGTLDAIEQGALSVAGVKTAQAFEVLDSFGRPARYVQLFVSDAYTESLASLSSVPPSYQTQSQVLALNVFNALDNIRAAGIYVQVQVSQVILQPIQLNLSLTAGFNVDLVAQQSRAAAVNYTNTLNPGSTWSRNAAQSAVVSVAGLTITGNEIASPQGDVVPTSLQVIRTSLAITLATALGTGNVLGANINPDSLSTGSMS